MSRRLVIGATVLLLAATAALGVHQLDKNPSTPTSTAGPSTGYGISGPLESLSQTELNRQLADMQSMGITWVRYDVNWSNIQQDGPTSYDWADTDRVARAVQAHHMNSLMILDFTPPWARPSGCDAQVCAPAQASDFGKFAAVATQRYQPLGVKAWEIWNEPNISHYFQPLDPADYTQLLQSADRQIKRIEPQATVIVGGPAPSSTADGQLSQLDFIKAIYAHGAHGYFDAIADHPYSYPAIPSNQDAPASNWGTLRVLHDYMVDHQDGDKQIWITEYGDPTGGPKPDDHNTEAEQAAMMQTAINLLHGDSWIGPFFWFNYQDSSTSNSSNEHFFGLLRFNGSPKPTYSLYRQLIAQYPPR